MCSIPGADHNDLWDEHVRSAAAFLFSRIFSFAPLFSIVLQFQDMLFTAIGVDAPTQHNILLHTPAGLSAVFITA
jgi:hypothetical protein